MIPVVHHTSPRPFSAAEQSLDDRFRAQLQPTADNLERGAPTFAAGARQRQAARAHREQARQQLYRTAFRSAPPCGFGVIELMVLRFVIGQMLSYILQRWLNSGGDDVAQDD